MLICVWGVCPLDFPCIGSGPKSTSNSQRTRRKRVDLAFKERVVGGNIKRVVVLHVARVLVVLINKDLSAFVEFRIEVLCHEICKIFQLTEKSEFNLSISIWWGVSWSGRSGKCVSSFKIHNRQQIVHYPYRFSPIVTRKHVTKIHINTGIICTYDVT